MIQILKSIEALLITNPTNIRYMTGFVGADPTAREAYVVVMKGVTYLLTSALYKEQANLIIQSSNNPINTNTQIEFLEIDRVRPLTKRLKQLFSKRSDLNKKGLTLKLGFEAHNLTVAEYANLNKKLGNAKLVPTNNIIENVRKIKSDKEIKLIKKAANLTDKCFDYIITQIKSGVTESELAWKIASFFRNKGAENAFSPIVAFGKNTSQPHYKPTSYQLQANKLILLDFGARVNGYCADMTRMVYFGKPNKNIINTSNTLLTAQENALELLQNGEISGTKLDQATRKVLEQNKLPTYPHSLGHAVGLDIHEAPRLTIKKDEILKPDMVITIEPGVYYEGRFGMRIEDLILVKEDGIEILSKTDKELKIL